MFKRKKEKINFETTFAVIESTDSAKNSFINDKFNKKICIYPNWESYEKRNPRNSIPFTEIDADNIRKVFKIPVIQEDLDLNIDFLESENFGEIMNRVR